MILRPVHSGTDDPGGGRAGQQASHRSCVQTCDQGVGLPVPGSPVSKPPNPGEPVFHAFSLYDEHQDLYFQGIMHTA